MSITRRQFTAGVGAGLALVVIGCGDEDGRSAMAHGDDKHGGKKGKNKNKANLAKEPFLIGALEKYREAGLYDQFKADKGVWVVSDGKQLVVLSATCTHLACTTHWKQEDQVFDCPCHKSRFDLGGINQAGSKAKRALERCSVRLVATDTGEQIEVDPTRRLREDKGQWSDAAASILFG